ncbi:MAG: TrkH family potassium uptake protein [Coprobacillus sp.]
MEAIDIHHGKKKRSFSPVRRIAFSFFMVIFIGSLLLSLPIANNGVTDYINHLFIATSATCVTGLVPVVVSEQYTTFGHLVILALIQIGGLGFLTLLNLVFVVFKKRLSFTNKIVMQEALNQNSLKDIGRFIKHVIKYTIFFELLGAIFLSMVFVPEFGLLKGIYYGVWHSISAFCNAGFDILGATSLISYQSNIIVNFTISGLIICGGLGFIVWVDIKEVIFNYRKKHNKFTFHKFFGDLAVHTKIVLVVTTLLLVGGTVAIYLLEMNNPATIGNLPTWQQWIISFFQSTTLRTAGFASVDIASLHESTKLLMSVFMFIGGSPAGTAGGIKTVTFAIVVLYIISLVKGTEKVDVFKRGMSDNLVKRALSIAIISFFLSMLGLFILSVSEKSSFIDLVFEIFSAFGTVGLSASVTPYLSVIGKIVIMALMYIGRIGPMTMLLVFAKKYNQSKGKGIIYPHGEVLIG